MDESLEMADDDFETERQVLIVMLVAIMILIPVLLLTILIMLICKMIVKRSRKNVRQRRFMDSMLAAGYDVDSDDDGWNTEYDEY